MRLFVLSLSSILLLMACGQTNDRVEITESRPKSTVNPPQPVETTTAERLGTTRMAQNTGGAAPRNPLHWTTPEGWTELDPTNTRLINFEIGDSEAECYLAALPGSAGGVEANVNRWRQQIGLEAYTAEEFQTLETREVLGQRAAYVAFDGTFTNTMSNEPPKENYRLVGAIFAVAEFTLFAKMVGEADVVRQHESNFDLFLSSLHSSAGHSHDEPADTSPTTSLPDDHPPIPDLPEDHPPIMRADSGASTPGPDSMSGDGFTWKAPEGWKRGGDRTMRLVTYTAGPNDSVECYVTVLANTGGGAVMNVNRWLGQVGNDPMTREEINALRTIPFLGHDAPVVEATGTYSSMGGPSHPGYMLVGTLVELGSRSVFIKMTGPEEAVREQIDAFEAFVASFDEP